ncbi:MAG: hypothetical protein ACLP8S_00090 [Solirubrobacteraceae bacterium]
MRDQGACRRVGGLRKAGFSFALLAAGFALIAAGVASAHGRGLGSDGFGRGVVPAAAGVVQSGPSGGSFTIETRSGATETIEVSSSTTYLERGVSSPSLTDVGSGDLIAAFGTTSGSTVTASQIVISVPRTPGSQARPVAAGIVQGTPGAASFTIQTHSGSSETIDVSSSTTYYERGVSSPSLTNVTSGEFVVAWGTASGSTVTASKIVVAGAPRPRHHSLAVAGTVQGSPSGDSFTITTPSGATDTVDVTSSTTYFERGVSSPSLGDVESGDYVAVFGSVSGSTVTATKVAIATPPPSNGKFATAGTVQTSPSGGSFVIETWDHGQVTVQTSSSTTYAERGVTAASLTNVTIGENVAVFGTVSGATVTATQIAIGGNGVGGGPGHNQGGAPGVHGGGQGYFGGSGSGYDIYPGGAPGQGGVGRGRGHGHGHGGY